MRFAGAVLSSLLATIAAAAPGKPASAAGTAGLQTALLSDLKRQFLADHGKVRLLLVFSPT